MMYCPKCGTENTDAASFCRGCGSNIALVPQALTGHLATPAPEALTHRERRALRRQQRHTGPEGAVVPIFGGLGFLLVACAVMLFMPGGHLWGFWLFIPAFFMMGGGVASYMRMKERQKGQQLPSYTPPPSSLPPPTMPRATDLPPRRRDTAEVLQRPGSVTEGTTRLLDHEQ